MDIKRKFCLLVGTKVDLVKERVISKEVITKLIDKKNIINIELSGLEAEYPKLYKTEFENILRLRTRYVYN